MSRRLSTESTLWPWWCCTINLLSMLSLLPVLTFVMWLINTCLIWKSPIFFYIPKVSGCLESVISFPFISLIERLMFVFGVFQVLSENNSHTRPSRLHSDQKLTTGIGKLSLFTVKDDQKLDVDLEVVCSISIFNIMILSVCFNNKGIHCYVCCFFFWLSVVYYVIILLFTSWFFKK